MMNKLIMRLIVMLIGLNLLYVYACHPFEFEKDEKLYYDIYRNRTDSAIKLTIKNSNNEAIDSIVINANNENRFLSSSIASEDAPVNQYLNSIISYDWVNIDLSVNNQLVRHWTAQDIEGHNPFNPNSWTTEGPSTYENGLRSRAIVFTITNDDLE